MRIRAVLLGALCLLQGGCWRGRLEPGPRKNTVVVETAASCPQGSQRRPCLERAYGQAVAGLLGLYVPAEVAAGPEVERGVLRGAGKYVKGWKAVEGARLRVEVFHEKLGRDLDALGLIKPGGVEGTPKILISLKEEGFAASPDVGRASDALRRFLGVRGYAALDLSDPLNPKGRQSTGGRAEALAAAAKLGADIVVTGSSFVEVSQDGQQDYQAFGGGVAAEALLAGSGAFLCSLDARASAVDASPEGAAVKALENAAELAGEKLAAALAERFRRRQEITLVVIGPVSIERTARLIASVRRVEGVAAAAAGQLGPGRVALRVFVEGFGADELAARLGRGVQGFSLQLRGVEPGARLVEMESAGAGGGF